MNDIVIKSFNGIGDLLFVTPTLRVIKEAYPNRRIIVNTNRPSLLKNNPFVDIVGSKNEGVFLMYVAPDSGKVPHQHHILDDWEIVCKYYGLQTEKPELIPELFMEKGHPKKDLIGVQVTHKRHYHSKRVWPYYEQLAGLEGFEAIPEISKRNKGIKEDEARALAYKIMTYKAVVCPEGGISHIAAALGMPAVVLMGGFTDPVWTGYSFHVNLVSDIDCKPCYNNSPCKHNFKCWEEYPLETVRDITLLMVKG